MTIITNTSQRIMRLVFSFIDGERREESENKSFFLCVIYFMLLCYECCVIYKRFDSFALPNKKQQKKQRVRCTFLQVFRRLEFV